MRAANTDPPACAQGPGGLLPGRSSTAEDCLYLSVYRPARIPAGRKLPVLFWMHGGGYGSGAGWLYDGSRLAAETGTVVVTVNYRLNVFGYLALASLDAEQGNSGNYGLLEQLAALRWVNRNIAAFGGDPHRIAIDGQSAGAMSVCDMLASPDAKGLFSAAVLQSGGTCTAASKSSYERDKMAVVKAVGCADDDAAVQVACLRSRSVSELLAAVAKAPEAASWNVVVGGNALPTQPLEAVESGRWNKVPVLLGLTRDEGRVALHYLGSRFPQSEEGYRKAVRSFFGDQADRVLAEYPSSNYTDPAYAEAAVLSDSGVMAGLGGCPTMTVADLFAKQTVTHFYELYDPNAPWLTVTPPSNGFQLGSTHSADLAYVFQDGFRQQARPLTAAQRALSDDIMGYWANFAASGNPNGGGRPDWPSYRGAGNGVVQLTPGTISSMPDYAAEHRCAFWRSLDRR